MKKYRPLSVLLLAVMFCSCHTNGIYFDMAKQTVNTSNERPIVRLYIVSSDSKESFFFELLANKKGVSKFSLESINKNYSVEVDTEERADDSSIFRLRPNAEYEISNLTYRDATSGRIVVRTDSVGCIVYSNKISPE